MGRLVHWGVARRCDPKVMGIGPVTGDPLRCWIALGS